MKFYRRRRVLVVCGEPRILAEIKKELMNRFDVCIAATGEAALAAMNAYGPEAVVVHIGRERSAAFSVFALISGEAADRGVPILFLAENDDESDEAAALEMGAADYAVRRHAGGALGKRIALRIMTSGSEENADANAPPEAILVGKTILIAEDIALNQEIIGAILSEAEGLTVDFASDGQEALELFEGNPDRYAMLFLDIHMPKMDGLSATRAIRALSRPEARTVPIVALTATAGQEEMGTFLEAGMNGYLKKPMEYAEFLCVCNDYMRPGGKRPEG